MGCFLTYMENRQSQVDAANRVLNALYYEKGLDLETIAKMPLAQVISLIESMGLLPTTAWSVGRFAAMIKSTALANLARDLSRDAGHEYLD